MVNITRLIRPEHAECRLQSLNHICYLWSWRQRVQVPENNASMSALCLLSIVFQAFRLADIWHDSQTTSDAQGPFNTTMRVRGSTKCG